MLKAQIEWSGVFEFASSCKWQIGWVKALISVLEGHDDHPSAYNWWIWESILCCSYQQLSWWWSLFKEISSFRSGDKWSVRTCKRWSSSLVLVGDCMACYFFWDCKLQYFYAHQWIFCFHDVVSWSMLLCPGPLMKEQSTPSVFSTHGKGMRTIPFVSTLLRLSDALSLTLEHKTWLKGG